MPQDSEKYMSEDQSGTDIEKNADRKIFIPGAMGERITYLRKRKKMTQAQLAEQLGISAQAVSKWESGLSCPDIMTLVPLSQVLGVSTDELLGVQGDMGTGGFEGIRYNGSRRTRRIEYGTYYRIECRSEGDGGMVLQSGNRTDSRACWWFRLLRIGLVLSVNLPLVPEPVPQ